MTIVGDFDPADAKKLVEKCFGPIKPSQLPAKLRSSLYDTMGRFGGSGLMDLLASFALFDDDPARINTLVTQFEKVTPVQVQKTAREYLRPTKRTIVALEPASKAGAEAPAKNQ